MTTERKHYNEHRRNKYAFQAMLTPKEQELLESVKAMRGIEQNKALLIRLLDEERQRLNEKARLE